MTIYLKMMKIDITITCNTFILKGDHTFVKCARSARKKFHDMGGDNSGWVGMNRFRWGE